MATRRNILLLLCVVLLAVCAAKSPQHKQKAHAKHENLVEKPVEKQEAEFRPHQEECGGTEDDMEKWCYVNIRPGAHSFYWLYRTTHADGWQNRPIVLWLQGGPGASSTGYGNFEIIGPLDLDLQPRETTWVQSANVLFVDNPIGAGYSYAETDDALTETTEEIAEDLFVLYQDFIINNPEFATLPLYVFGQSYGGKMGVVFAERLAKGIDDGEITATLGGYAMGNSWIAPVESTLSWAPFLYYMGNLDEYGYSEVMLLAQNAADAAAAGDWEESTSWWGQTEYRIWDFTNYIDFYNILKYNVFTREQMKKAGASKTAHMDEFMLGLKMAAMHNESIAKLLTPELMADPLDDIMNGVIKEKLAIIPEDIVWGAQSDAVFSTQAGHFMRPVVDYVGRMLTNYPEVHSIVYQGQLDLICDTKGAMDYIQMLEPHWAGLGDYNVAERFWLTHPESGQTEMFYKVYQNLKFYWVNLAGHAVPKDRGDTALRMLNRILDNVDVNPRAEGVKP